jgi:hypothetical protein
MAKATVAKNKAPKARRHGKPRTTVSRVLSGTMETDR